MNTLRDLEVSRAFPAKCIRVRVGAEQLVLRPTVMSDAEAICSDVLSSLPELKRFMPWAHAEHTPRYQLSRLREAEAVSATGRELVLGLFGPDGGMRGMVGLHPRVALNPDGLEIGYWAPTRHAGKGWTTLATKLATIYAFDKLGANRVQVMCDDANVASRRVIEKCEFEFEGIQRNVTPAATAELVAGGYEGTTSSRMYALIPSSFEALAWVAPLRASMSYVNLGGYDVR